MLLMQIIDYYALKNLYCTIVVATALFAFDGAKSSEDAKN
jgi:hypothetical protein